MSSLRHIFLDTSLVPFEVDIRWMMSKSDCRIVLNFLLAMLSFLLFVLKTVRLK